MKCLDWSFAKFTKLFICLLLTFKRSLYILDASPLSKLLIFIWLKFIFWLLSLVFVFTVLLSDYSYTLVFSFYFSLHLNPRRYNCLAYFWQPCHGKLGAVDIWWVAIVAATRGPTDRKEDGGLPHCLPRDRTSGMWQNVFSRFTWRCSPGALPKITKQTNKKPPKQKQKKQIFKNCSENGKTRQIRSSGYSGLAWIWTVGDGPHWWEFTGHRTVRYLQPEIDFAPPGLLFENLFIYLYLIFSVLFPWPFSPKSYTLQSLLQEK